jgi:ketosteroid isomerase-like protein
MRYRPVLFVAVALCVASAGALRAQSQDPIAGLLAQWESTFNAGHYDATAALYTPDAIRYPPGADPQRGTDDIVADMQNYSGITIKLTLVGTYELTGKDEDGNTISQGGPWMDVVVKSKDGSWKIWRDIWNSSQPEEGS